MLSVVNTLQHHCFSPHIQIANNKFYKHSVVPNLMNTDSIELWLDQSRPEYISG